MWDWKKLHLRNAVFASIIALTFMVILPGVSASSAPSASAEMYYSMGRGYAVKDDFDMAVVAFEKAVASSLDWPEAHNALGEAYAKLLRFEDALAEFDKALELKKDYMEADMNRRRAMIAVKQYKPMQGSRLRPWHKVAILGIVTAAVAVISAIIVYSTS